MSQQINKARPAWQLPPGVSRGAWDYATEPSIATEYDTFHSGHPLLELDQQLVRNHLGSIPMRENGEPKIAIDLGCGTGRNILPLAQLGWQVIGVDLSTDMLDQVNQKSKASSNAPELVATVHANMVDLDCFGSQIADAVLCMYSSLGMVQGRTNRRRVLAHMQRMLRPDGRCFVHVHNRGSWLRDPGGIRRSCGDWVRSRYDASWEYGDRIYPYRSLPSMFLHIYSERELRQDLAASNLIIEEMIVLNRESSGPLKGRWLSYLRAGGFVVVAKRA